MFTAYWYGGARPFPTGHALAKLCLDLRKHGVTGYLPQYALDEARKHIERDDVLRICDEHGIELQLGLGLDKGRSTPTNELHEKNVTKAIIAALELRARGGVTRVSLDWEGYWDGKRAMAARIVQKVLDEHPDAGQHADDCPWWAPLFTIDSNGRKRGTHPSAPTQEFGRIVRRRIVQAYGAQADGSPDGRSLAMLKWARSPTQYASLGAWDVLPTTQLYARSLNDHVRTLLTEPEQVLWTWNEIDARARKALRVVEALRERGFVGANAVEAFQKAVKIAVDGVVGPVTLFHLGLGPKP